MTRRTIAVATLLMVGALIAADLMTSRPLDPFKAPPMLAFGSGAPASGAHCASLPSAD